MSGPTDAVAEPGGEGSAGTVGDRDASALHRDALAIRRLLDDLDEDEHALRSRLLGARLLLRAEAATAWRGRGWRPVTDER